MSKHPGGRPPKYEGAKTCQAVCAFSDEMTPQNFHQRCSLPHVALLLKVNKDTINEWRKAYPEFSVSIKSWETKRDALAFEVRGWSDARWIFCMKNWTEMKDRHELDHSGDVKQTIVFEMSRPEKANG